MRVYLDSNIFIYALARQEPFAKEALNLLHSIESGTDIMAFSSTIIFGEVIGLGKSTTPMHNVHSFLQELPNFYTLPVTEGIAKSAGMLRQKYGKSLRLPDAIHLASSMEHQALFVTADARLLSVAEKLTKVRSLDTWK